MTGKKLTFLTKLFLTIMLANIGFASAKVDEKIESIVESLTKSNEKPQISKGSCIIPCPEDIVENLKPCHTYPGLKEMEKNSILKGTFPSIARKEHYEIESKKKGKSLYINDKVSGNKLFVVKIKKGTFKGQRKSKNKRSEERFIKEYESLLKIFGEIEFTELCRYLRTRAYEYGRLKRFYPGDKEKKW